MQIEITVLIGRAKIRPHLIFFLDFHPNFEKLWACGRFIFFFTFPASLKNSTLVKETFNTLKLNCQNE